jgi:hypothetical protein
MAKHLRCVKNAAGWYVIRDPKARREWRARLYAEQDGRCALYGHAFPPPDKANESIRKAFAPTFDHIVRYANGGSSDLENLRLAHAACNWSLGAGREPICNVCSRFVIEDTDIAAAHTAGQKNPVSILYDVGEASPTPGPYRVVARSRGLADPDSVTNDEIRTPDHAGIVEFKALSGINAPDLLLSSGIRRPKLRCRDTFRKLSRVVLCVPWPLEVPDRDVVHEIPRVVRL